MTHYCNLLLKKKKVFFFWFSCQTMVGPTGGTHRVECVNIPDDSLKQGRNVVLCFQPLMPLKMLKL